jgi:peptide/nickel transport system substrate-binding protein
VKNFFKNLGVKAKKIFSFWQKKLSPDQPALYLPIHVHLDKRLVLGLTRQRHFPSWPQIKLIQKFLKPTERKAILLLLLTLVAGLLSLGGEFILKHRITLPKTGGEYIEGAIGSPSSVNPLYSPLNSVDADLSRLIYAGLLKYDDRLNLVPDLAESYKIDKDGKVFTFKLKRDLKWQDGEALTADDVAFTISRIQNPETQSPLWVSWQGIEFEKIDDQNFTLTLPEPFSPFLPVLTTGLLPEHLWQEVSPANMKLSGINLKPIGAGPYMFATLNKDSKGNIKTYGLKTSPYYYARAPYLTSVTFKFFPDFESAMEALRNHQISGLGYLPKDQKDKIGRKSVIAYSLRSPYFSALFFNQKKNLLLKSAILKKALATSVDRDQIITRALKNDGVVINGPILPNQPGFTQDFKIKYDLNQAQKILDDDGWKRISREDFLDKRQKELYQAWLDEKKVAATAAGIDPKKKLTAEETAAQKKEADEYLKQLGEDLQAQTSPRQTFFRHKNNYGLTIKITTLNQPEFVQTAAIIKDAWQDLGVQVSVETLEIDQLKDAIKNRDYEILLYGIMVGADPDPYPFWHSSQITSPGLNLSGFSNKSADQLLEKARTTYDLTTKAKYYYDFQKLLAADLPAMFLYTSTYLYPLDNTIKGFNQYRIYQPADRFAGIANWYLQTKSGWK